MENTLNDNNNWRNDPALWKFGIFYFNKKDSRIFPPKKPFYGGWTVNFANPRSLLINFGLLALLYFIIFILASRENFKSHRYDKEEIKKEVLRK